MAILNSGKTGMISLYNFKGYCLCTNYPSVTSDPLSRKFI